MSMVEHFEVSCDDEGMRLDRWLRSRFPGVGFVHAQKLIRSGQIRIDGGRVKADTRVKAGQSIRIPPIVPAPSSKQTKQNKFSLDDINYIESLVIYRDHHVIALNKPPGLATQGGSGISEHVDRLLPALSGDNDVIPRLVHRLDRDTSGVLLIALNRTAAAALSKSLKSKRAQKIYWAIARGIPSPSPGRISNFIAPDEQGNRASQVVVRQGTPSAQHAVTNFEIVDRAGAKVSWIKLEPETGRKHQLRVHMAHIGHPILFDSRYFNVENWSVPGGLVEMLCLHARRIVLPHPAGGILDVRAKLPEHLKYAFDLLGFDQNTHGADLSIGGEKADGY